MQHTRLRSDFAELVPLRYLTWGLRCRLCETRTFHRRVHELGCGGNGRSRYGELRRLQLFFGCFVVSFVLPKTTACYVLLNLLSARFPYNPGHPSPAILCTFALREIAFQCSLILYNGRELSWPIPGTFLRRQREP